MAIRNLRFEGDEILRKKSKKVTNIDSKIITLLDDMAETMYKAEGVGLAAPQVGILKRIAIIDIGEGLIELINPEIIETRGEHLVVEGCLSVRGPNGELIRGELKRPQSVVVKALNREGKEFTIEGKDLLAQALCHEIDHLDGILFIDKVIRFVDTGE